MMLIIIYLFERREDKKDSDEENWIWQHNLLSVTIIWFPQLGPGSASEWVKPFGPHFQLSICLEIVSVNMNWIRKRTIYCIIFLLGPDQMSWATGVKP